MIYFHYQKSVRLRNKKNIITVFQIDNMYKIQETEEIVISEYGKGKSYEFKKICRIEKIIDLENRFTNTKNTEERK